MDFKYHYLYWRPITAICGAGLDSSNATTADSSWSPLLTTPTILSTRAPTVASARPSPRCSLPSSRHTINVDVPGATGSGTTLTTSQHFNTTQDLLQNVANARVWAGLRYRFSTTAGVGLGKQVADCDLQHNFQPAGR
jgi:hypothetical protein